MQSKNSKRSLRLGIRRLVALCLFATMVIGLAPPVCVAQQMSSDMRGLFEKLAPSLDDDLEKKVREALRQDRPWLELTVDQFERFRDHPDNPFEGWDGIDTNKIDGVIRLQFESQPIRSRVPDSYERQADPILNDLAPVAGRIHGSTVSVTNGKTQVALGMVVTAEGHVLTKLSEVAPFRDSLYCKASDGQRFSAIMTAMNRANDVAILKIEKGVLPPVIFADEQPDPGAFLLTTNYDSQPLALGIYSNPPRSLVGDNQAFLGVKPESSNNGVVVVEVTKGSAAEAAGVLPGDILLRLDGQPLTDVASLVNGIRFNTPGDEVVLDVLRNGQPKEIVATLLGRTVGGPSADRFSQMETFGALQSKRRDEFPLVFQHDTPLVPEQCGGPVLDLDGRVVGMNIARGGRVASYAIPAPHLKQLVRELTRPIVASSEID